MAQDLEFQLEQQEKEARKKTEERIDQKRKIEEYHNKIQSFTSNQRVMQLRCDKERQLRMLRQSKVNI